MLGSLMVVLSLLTWVAPVVVLAILPALLWGAGPVLMLWGVGLAWLVALLVVSWFFVEAMPRAVSRARIEVVTAVRGAVTRIESTKGFAGLLVQWAIAAKRRVCPIISFKGDDR